MAEISKLNNLNVPVDPNQSARVGSQVFDQDTAAVGQPGLLGQPVGQPVPLEPGQRPPVLPDVLTGRDPSQRVAAERLRESGGVSATEELLGLNLQPSMLGAFPAPPGNLEALRHMTPTMRRTLMRTLLTRQREQMRRLTNLLLQHDARNREQADEQHKNSDTSDLSEKLSPLNEKLSQVLDHSPGTLQCERARNELGRAASMLDLLDDLLEMQDHALSQMGAFSQG